jgi:hypothetical protein
MQGSAFDELEFFRAIARSNARALLIGRRALVVLGLPVLTADYDFWVHPDDALHFNEAVKPFGLRPNRPPPEARAHGRYVLENDEHVDVLLANAVSTVDGVAVTFEGLWARRTIMDLTEGVSLAIPSLEDLIATKRVGARPKDAEDIRLLEALLRRRAAP